MRDVSERVARAFPRGPLDAAIQLGLFALIYMCYQSVRGLVDGSTVHALANAHAIVSLEQGMGLFFERSLQASLLNHKWLIEAADFAYMNSHFVITTAFLVWLYFYRNKHFYFVRNMFMVAMGLALVGYLLVPTAPPRMLPGLGFVDTIAKISHVNTESATAKFLINPYAAIPSMHIAFSLMIAGPAVMLVKNRALKMLWCLYPAVVFFVIVITGNHFWFDAAMGTVVAITSTVVAQRVLTRVKPAVWAWQAEPEEAAAYDY